MPRIRFISEHIWSIVSIVLIVGVGAIMYRPVLEASFWVDDYGLLGKVVRLSLPEYLDYYFNPFVQTIWYRPLQGMGMWMTYALLGGEPPIYHIIQVALHLINCILLFGLVTHISRRWRLGLLTALIYVTWELYALAVYWATVADPLLSFFYLLTIWFWFCYLEGASRIAYGLALISLGCALLTKEMAAVLPAILFLMDRWVVAKPATLWQLVKRYWVFAVIGIMYAWLEIPVLSHGAFTRDSGYGAGAHIIGVMLNYLTHMVFPWFELPVPLNYLVLALVVLAFLYLAARRRWQIVFIGVTAFLVVSPLFPFRGTYTRYYYLPLMACAVGYAVLFYWILERINQMPMRRVLRVTLMIVIAWTVWQNTSRIANGAEGFVGATRETRARFKSIFQLHKLVAPDTFFYFVDPFLLSRWDLDGLLALKFGKDATASGVDYDMPADLRAHNESFIVYQDDQNVMREQKVDKWATIQTAPDLPIQFEKSIWLDRYELGNNRAKPGDAFTLILYWRATKQLEQDYVVYVHIVDKDGKQIAAYDSRPTRGKTPTPKWPLNWRVIDPIIVSIPPNAPLGDHYRMELGMYDAVTMQRLMILGADGQPATDTIMLGPFGVEK